MPRPGTGATSREDLRRKNLAAIFDAIHRVGPVSRTDLATTLGLSPATVSSITADLIRTGMVYEAEQGVSSRAGRKPILLDIDYDHDFVVGAKLSATTLTVAITNLRAEVRVARDAALADHAPEDVADVIARTVHAAARAAGLEEAALAGMCLSVPGIVDAATGRVRHSPLPAWCQAPLADLVHDRLAIPVMIENDVNALAVAEAWFGAGSDHADFLVVTLGRGVGTPARRPRLPRPGRRRGRVRAHRPQPGRGRNRDNGRGPAVRRGPAPPRSGAPARDRRAGPHARAAGARARRREPGGPDPRRASTDSA